jgi:hypothetical protein
MTNFCRQDLGALKVFLLCNALPWYCLTFCPTTQDLRLELIAYKCINWVAHYLMVIFGLCSKPAESCEEGENVSGEVREDNFTCDRCLDL